MGRAVRGRLAAERIRLELHNDHFAQRTPGRGVAAGGAAWLGRPDQRRAHPLPAKRKTGVTGGAFVFASGNLSGQQMGDAIARALPQMLKLLATHRGGFVARITAASDVAILPM